jgi:signal peptidase I
MESLALAALVAAAVAMAVRRLCWLTRIRSWSMYPTLHPVDWVPTRRLRGAESIRRGDIVVIASAELGRRVVKRVIGLPGETVNVGPYGVTIDDLPLLEPYVAVHGGPAGRFCVPRHAYLVLGDNRTRSSDSRSWMTPFVPISAVLGRLVGRPLNRRRRQASPTRPSRGSKPTSGDIGSDVYPHEPRWDRAPPVQRVEI